MKRSRWQVCRRGAGACFAAGGAATFLPARCRWRRRKERDADAAQGGGAPLLLSGSPARPTAAAIAGCRLDLVGNDGVVAQVVTDGAGRFCSRPACLREANRCASSRRTAARAFDPAARAGRCNPRAC